MTAIYSGISQLKAVRAEPPAFDERRRSTDGLLSSESYCAEESIGLMKRRIMTASARPTTAPEPQGITQAQWGPLYMLRRPGLRPWPSWRASCRADPGAMTRLLDRLEAKGFCRRLRSADDRRVVHIELTAEGGAAGRPGAGPVARS